MKRVIKISVLAIVYLLLSLPDAFATHQRAAEITYRHISGLTYEVRVITYVYSKSQAYRPRLDVYWGDGSYSTLERADSIPFPGDIQLNIYEYRGLPGDNSYRHTYSSPGNYMIYMEDPNRNLGVVNIPNSVNVPMYVQTLLVINPFLGYNNSPVLLNPPVDLGCVNRIFIHNPGAYDPDGDSLSYKLVSCKTAGGIDIPGFTQPMASNSFTINPRTGDLVWDTPVLQGEYNMAFIIEEWRNGNRIGYVTRDMQVEVLACSNIPPVILAPEDTCVTAGDTLQFDVRSYDPDGNPLTLSASGGPFELENSPAYIDPDPASGTGDTISTTFFWATDCAHVQNQPYQVFFKAEDNNFPVGLVTYKTVGISVLCPAPENLSAESLGSTIRLKWDMAACNQATGYHVYRKIGYLGFLPDNCETGVPPYTGYTLIHQNASVADTSFTDDDNGNGLIHGIQYCYMVIAYFDDGAESYASLEACASLKRDIPVITNASNDSANLQAGKGFVAWSKPTELDTVQIPGPYQYVVYRSDGPAGANFLPVATRPGLNDTTWFDNEIDLNSSGIPYSYRIALESLTFGFIGNSQLASTIFLEITETDEELQLSFQPNVPWFNDYYVIYRRDEGSPVFDSVGFSIVPYFSDTGLVNGDQYCYYVKSVGGYSASGYVDPIINFSQIRCAVPYDNKPPCPPELSISVNCDLAINTLNWTNPNDYCADDVLKYLVFFTPLEGLDLVLIDSTSPATSTTYEHFNNGNIAGCYAVIAVDSTGNLSDFSNLACMDIDSCSVYSLPNVFTPNFDGYNDIYQPLPYTSVERVDMTIFNRWGGIVYETEDPNINWDGKDINTKQDCSDGVYFYVCKVYEITLYGVVPRELRGSITLLRE